MRGFRFSLEKVLEVRELRRLANEHEFSKCLSKVRKTEEGLLDLKKTRDVSLDLYRGSILGKLDVFKLRDFQRFHKDVEGVKIDLLATLKKQEEESERAREGVILSMKDQKVLENLKLKKRRHFQKVYWQEETKALDEVGSIRFVSKGDSR